MNVSCTSCATVFRVDPAKVPAAGVRARCSVCQGIFWVRHAGVATAAMAPEPSARPELSARPESTTHRAAPVAPAASASPAPELKPILPLPPTPQPVTSPLTDAPRFAAPAVAPVAPAPRPTTQPKSPSPALAPPAFAGRPGGPAIGQPPTRPAQSVPPPVVPAATVPVVPMAPIVPDLAPPPVSRMAPPASVIEVPKATVPAVRKPRANPFLSQDPSAKARRLARALISDMVVYHPAKRREGIVNGSLKQLFDEEIKKSWEEYVDQVGHEVAQSTPFFNDALNEILADGQLVFP